MTDAACAILSTGTNGALAASVRPLMGRGGRTTFAVVDVDDDIVNDAFFYKFSMMKYQGMITQQKTIGIYGKMMKIIKRMDIPSSPTRKSNGYAQIVYRSMKSCVKKNLSTRSAQIPHFF